MRVSELAERSGASARSIRHYDLAGLLSSRRLPNGYRDFDELAIEEVRQIRDLLLAGLSIRDIITIRPCLDLRGAVAPCELASTILSRHVQRLDQRIAADRKTRALLQGKLRPTGEVQAVGQ